MNNLTRLVVTFAFIILLVSMVTPAVSSHGFGERYDLPIPLSYFVIGAGMTVALSFVVIGLFIRSTSSYPDYPKRDLWNSTSFRLLAKATTKIFRVSSVLIVLIAIFSGLYGSPDPLDNLLPTLFWIIWWIGIGYIVALIGNVWAIANPFLVIFEWGEHVFGKRASFYKWPEHVDAWPALALFLLFGWIENVYPSGSKPFNLAFMIVLYGSVTLAGMFVFGKHTWLKKADPFSVLFSLFARFSPTEIRVINPVGSSLCQTCTSGCAENSDLPDCVDCYDCWERAPESQKRFMVRPWSAGLTRGERVSTALVAFHITALATVTFDGLAETPAWVFVQTAVWPLVDPLPGPAVAMIETLGIFLVPLIFAGIYVYLCGIVSRLSGSQLPKNDVIRSFVFSLVPIALAYNLSHYISFVLITGQQIVPLVSNPFGFGLGDWAFGQGSATPWDLFGTSAYVPNIAIIDARFAWLFSVVALVVGHIISVFVAHLISLRRLDSHSLAIKSQYPMLVLMVFYTSVSLWIIAQPIVE